MSRTSFTYIFFLLSMLLFAQKSNGQELNAVVSVSIPKLQSADPKVFDQLQHDLQDFLNQEHWTDDDYKQYERIDCNFQVNITAELGNNTYTADVAIKAI